LSTNKKDGDGDAIPTKKRRGRPPKSEIVSRKRGEPLELGVAQRVMPL
jgi:hypothetical protein